MLADFSTPKFSGEQRDIRSPHPVSASCIGYKLGAYGHKLACAFDMDHKLLVAH